MTELPLHQAHQAHRGEAGSRAQNLGRLRDVLRPLSQERRDAYHAALGALSIDVVFHTLRLTGEPVERDALEKTEGDSGDLIRGQFKALRHVLAEAERGSSLTPELLGEIHRLSSAPSDGSFRSVEAPRHFLQPPSRPELVAERVQNLLEWLSADSGRSMHPAERAALAFARLLEIAPFERGNFRTGHLLLSFFAAAEAYPPLFLRVEDSAAIRSEIDRAMVFDTAPLVERLLDAMQHSLERCLAAVETGARPPST